MAPDALEGLWNPLVQRQSGRTKHGNHIIDVPFMSEITDGLWQGGVEDGMILPSFIQHVVSLYPYEAYEARHVVASTLTVQMPDTEDADLSQVDRIAVWVLDCLGTGPVLVNCQSGLNRSGLIVARALMMDGLSADEAISLVREKRSPAALCNPAFERWLRSPAAGRTA
jgi:hypothetical protein